MAPNVARWCSADTAEDLREVLSTCFRVDHGRME
jgi:hypothetical protein